MLQNIYGSIQGWQLLQQLPFSLDSTTVAWLSARKAVATLNGMAVRCRWGVKFTFSLISWNYSSVKACVVQCSWLVSAQPLLHTQSRTNMCMKLAGQSLLLLLFLQNPNFAPESLDLVEKRPSTVSNGDVDKLLSRPNTSGQPRNVDILVKETSYCESGCVLTSFALAQVDQRWLSKTSLGNF